MADPHNVFDLRAGRALPGPLTWNASLHEGVEQVELCFEAPPGAYLFELDVRENHVRRIRAGANIRWDGPSRRMTSHGMREYDLRDKLLKQWAKQVDGQIEVRNPLPVTMDFWQIDDCLNQPMTSLFTVQLDGREIGVFAEHFPRYAMRSRDQRRTRHIAIPIIIESNGSHVLRLQPHHLTYAINPDAVFERYSSQRIDLQRARLSTRPMAVADHPLRRGKVRAFPVDFWGWEASLFYQRADPAGASPTYLRKVFAESFRRGANFVDLYLTDCNHTICPGYAGIVPWPDDLGIDGRERYQFNGSTGWTAARLRGLNRAAHQTGLAISWYMHVPHKPNHYEVEPGWMQTYASVVLEQFASPGQADGIDGLLFESAGFAVDVDMMLLHETVGAVNPGLFFCESESHAVRTTAGLVPSRLDYFTCMGRVREDKDPDVAHFDPQWDTSKYGDPSHFGQLNCRDIKWCGSYGDVGQDAIVKQVSDFVRTHGDDSTWPGRASGFEWLGEPLDTTSPAAREMVYAASGDPVVAALAGRMETYGRGGRYDQARQRRQPFWFRSRFTGDIDCRDLFIQNNFMRAYIPAARDGGAWVFDTSATAHYDSDSPTLSLSRSLVSTVSDGSVELQDKSLSVEERGPYRATVNESLLLATNQSASSDPTRLGTIHEQRRYRCYADSPGLHIDVTRHFDIAQPDVATVVSLPGYDRCRGVRGKKWSVDLSIDGKPLVMKDSRGLLPALCIVVRTASRALDRVQWQAGSSLALWWHNPRRRKLGVGTKDACPVADAEHAVSLDIIVLGPLYRERDVAKLVDLRRHVDNRSPVSGCDLPIVRAVPVGGDRALPAMVNEDGWWRFRGVQPCGKDDLVKMYLPPRGQAKVRRWGFLADRARPAPGSQYLVHLRDVSASRSGAMFTARVNAQTPALLPRVEMTQSIAEVRIDGEQWPCFEDRTVLLPKREGVYNVKVRFGEATIPHLVSTHALIERPQWSSDVLRLDAGLPAYTRRLPRSVYLYAAVHAAGRTFTGISGAECVREDRNMLIIRFKPGRIEVRFDAD